MKSMFSQYKQKKKRRVNPDIPRPNLMSHEVKIKEQSAKIEEYERGISEMRSEVDRLSRKVRTLENTVNRLLTILKR